MGKQHLIEGVYKQINESFGFIDVEGEEKGYYVYEKNRSRALSGDRVAAKLHFFKGKKEAIITHVIEREKRIIVGEYTEYKNNSFVIPQNKNFPNDIFIAPKNRGEAKNGSVVGVKILKWEKEKKNPEGKIVEVLGSVGDVGLRVKSLLLEGGVKLEFPKKVIEEVDVISNEISEKEWRNREVRTNMFTFTIDGEDAKDLDDAISIKQKENGDYRLYVHIADVSHYVKEKGALYKELLERATSLYPADRVIPMLPEKLSNNLCSLNPNTDKLTLTCEMLIDKDGQLQKTTVYESIINSNFRLTYKEVDEILAGKIVIGDELQFGGKVDSELIEQLKISFELKEKISRFRDRNGTLDFDFPETKIIFSDAEKTKVESIQEYPRYDSNKIIEHFMVSANEAVSRKFHSFPFLYRVHANPEEGDVMKLQNTLSWFGVKHNISLSGECSTKDIDLLLQDVAKLEDGKKLFLEKMILRTLAKAVYSHKNVGHFGLGLKHYSHFTSPIRRAPDFIIHQIIKEKLQGKLDAKRIAHYNGSLEEIANRCSEKERAAERLEYKIRDYFMVQFYKEKIGQEFDGMISGVIPSGFFVVLPDTVEGFVEMRGYLNDMLHEIQIAGKKYRLGDKIRVKLYDTDEERLRLCFHVV